MCEDTRGCVRTAASAVCRRNELSLAAGVPRAPHMPRSTHAAETERMFPSGSLNHATLSPVGAVQIPSSSCLKKPKISKCTPFFCSARTTFSIPVTCHPRIVNCAGVKSANFRHPNHDSIRVEHHRKAVILDETKPQHAFVKRPRLLGILGRHKSDDVGGTQHERSSSPIADYDRRQIELKVDPTVLSMAIQMQSTIFSRLSLKSIITGSDRNQFVLYPT